MAQTAVLRLKTFFGQYPPVTHKQGTVLIREIDVLTGVTYLESGVVAMQTTTASGETHTLHLFKPQAFFPLTWALNSIPNQAQFVAITPVTVRVAPVKIVRDWLKTEPLVLFDLSQRLLSALDGVMHQVESLMSGSAQTRVLSVLRTLALRFGKPQTDGTVLIQLKLSHQSIALLAGISRETVTREIKKLQELGVLVIEKKQYFFRVE
jgi:CRP-like cAMP-binding protein